MTIPAARLVFPEDDREEILARIRAVLERGWLTLGPQTAELERKFADRHDIAHAVAVSSGTSALEIILRALGVGGRQVVVPVNTFFATAAAVVHAGGVPRFADIGAATMMLTLETVQRAVTDDTAGVIIVHIGGMISPEIVAIAAFCDERGLFLVEDAAHASGSRWEGWAAGSFGVAGAFSFYPTKIVTSGEGGMIATNSPRIAEEALVYRDQGKERFDANWHVRLGHNWRLSEFHAAVGVVQLRRLEQFIETKRAVAGRYDEALAGLPRITPLREPTGARANYHKYVAILDEGIDRQVLKQRLRQEHGVALGGEVYDQPLHVQPVFRHYSEGAFPVAEDLCARHVCLPIHSDMSLAEADVVVEALTSILGNDPRARSETV